MIKCNLSSIGKNGICRKGVKKMSKLMFALAIFSILSFGFVANSHALTIFDGTKLVGAMVKARDGVELGRVWDLVITSQGKVDFAIVSQVAPPGADLEWYGHIVAVPFSVLTISEGKSPKLQVVFNADKEKFYEAPEVPSSFFHNGGQVNRQKVAKLERYFGVQPSWTERGMTKYADPYSWGGEAQGF
jgi:hypothetical protein